MPTQTTHTSDGAASDGTTSTAPPELSLPELTDVDEDDAGLVGRTVGWTLALIGALIGVAVLVGAFVEIDLTVDAPGTLEPQTVWPVRAQESGTVASVPVTSGDTVQAGDVLARLDSMDLIFQRAQLKAQRAAQNLALRRAEAADAIDGEKHRYAVEEAQASLVRAKANLRDRLAAHGRPPDVDSVLSSYSAGSHVGLDRAVSDVETARAKLRSIRADLGQTRVRRLDHEARKAKIRRLDAEIREIEAHLDRLTLTAPTRGVVLTDQLERLAGRYVEPGDLLLEVAALDGWHATMYVAEQGVYHVQPGDPVKLEVRAFRDDSRELLHGHVTQVASEPAANAGPTPNGGGRYRVTVRLPDSEVDRVGRGRLKQGYSVQGEVITRSGQILSLAWDYVTGEL